MVCSSPPSHSQLCPLNQYESPQPSLILFHVMLQSLIPVIVLSYVMTCFVSLLYLSSLSFGFVFLFFFSSLPALWMRWYVCVYGWWEITPWGHILYFAINIWHTWHLIIWTCIELQSLWWHGCKNVNIHKFLLTTFLSLLLMYGSSPFVNFHLLLAVRTFSLSVFYLYFYVHM